MPKWEWVRSFRPLISTSLWALSISQSSENQWTMKRKRRMMMLKWLKNKNHKKKLTPKSKIRQAREEVIRKKSMMRPIWMMMMISREMMDSRLKEPDLWEQEDKLIRKIIKLIQAKEMEIKEWKSMMTTTGKSMIYSRNLFKLKNLVLVFKLRNSSINWWVTYQRSTRFQKYQLSKYGKNTSTCLTSNRWMRAQARPILTVKMSWSKC